jgi:hypothetical protein
MMAYNAHWNSEENKKARADADQEWLLREWERVKPMWDFLVLSALKAIAITIWIMLAIKVTELE